MRVPTNFLRLALLAVAIGGLMVPTGAAAGTHANAVRVHSAVEAPAVGASGRTAAFCARSAKRKTRNLSRARRIRRVRTAVRRRCLIRLRRGAKRQQAQRSTVATTVSADLVIGVDGGYAGWSDTETGERAALGAAVTRHEWDPSEPVDEQDDVVLSAAGQIGTRIHALLGGNQLGDAAHYRDWTISFIRRYGVGGSFWDEHSQLDESRYAITSFELGNEPYFGEMSAELYADTVRPTLEEVRRLGLPAKIVLPSRVYGTDTAWIDTLYQRIPDLNSLVYAFADHPYWYAHDPAQISPAGPFGRIDVLRRRMNEKGAADKPIFITEYGESTASCGGECVSEAVQAGHLQAMLEAVTTRTDWGVEMLSVFQLRDRGTNSGDRELQFGLLRQDGTAKPSYALVRDAMQRFRG